MMRPLLLLLLLFSTCPADELYVSNTLFEHTLVEGKSVLVNLEELGQALNLEVGSADGRWQLAEYPLKTVEIGGKVWVRLSELPSELVRVKKSPALGTIDIFNAVTEPVKQNWGGDAELVYFFLEDSPPCRDMEATIQTLEESRQITVTRVDVNQRRSRVFKEYRDLFQTNSVPFFVLLDGNGYYLHHFWDFKTYPQIMGEIKKGLSR